MARYVWVFGIIGWLGVSGGLAQELGQPSWTEEDVVQFATLAQDQTSESPSAAPDCTCDQIQAAAAAAAGSHKGLFYNNSFAYLCDECYQDCLLGDALKRNSFGPLIVDVGGQYRLRYHNEHNMRGLGLTGVDDGFLLERTRLYGNAELPGLARFYVEMIDAVSSFEDQTPRLIEEDRVELLNLFADVRLLSDCRGDLWGRIGRQELLYGDQRVISPLDWANTRRTFEGGKLYWIGENWNVDAFWVRPIYPTLANVHSLNSPDQSQEYSGVYSTYKGFTDETVDLYFTRFIETDGAGFDYNTFGARYQGQYCDWRWDVEAAVQYGDVVGVNNDAGFYTIGLGRQFTGYCWKPTLWAYYDWASGDDAGPAGSAPTGRGYHHQFPLGHKYLGFMDLFGRRNIEDLNFLLTAKPTDKVQLLAWWHIFHLQNDDVPYTVVMTSAPGATLTGGDADLGQELDLTASIQTSPRTGLLLGYSHFFAGDFYSSNASPGLFDGDADFYYAQFHVNF